MLAEKTGCGGVRLRIIILGMVCSRGLYSDQPYNVKLGF